MTPRGWIWWIARMRALMGMIRVHYKSAWQESMARVHEKSTGQSAYKATAWLYQLALETRFAMWAWRDLCVIVLSGQFCIGRLHQVFTMAYLEKYGTV